MNLDHRSKLAIAVLAALVVPSVLAWGLQAILPGGSADRASTTAQSSSESSGQSAPSATPSEVTPTPPTPTPLTPTPPAIGPWGHSHVQSERLQR